jgi:hypothetical protein
VCGWGPYPVPIKFALLCLAAALLAGCSALTGPYKFKRESAGMGCPPSEIERIANTRARLGLIQPGATQAKELKFLGTPIRTLTLARAEQADLAVAFYPLSLETCRWVNNGPNYFPIIMQQGREGLVLGTGQATLMELHAQGWEIGTRRSFRAGWWGYSPQSIFEPTPWPWQSYNYSYLPRR